ncbi:MAG: hypothetical protein HYV76_02980 [Candidatus Vogelbacteria bacterium]|nr:hypothetical protein [Candidatus Vogelbacteria bacterium]
MPLQPHKIKFNIAWLLLVVNLLPVITQAAVFVETEDSGVWNNTVTGDNITYDGDPNQDRELVPDNYNSGSNQASSQLQQNRSKDKQKCQGSKYFDGLAGKLQGVLQERLPEIIEGALLEQLPEQFAGILNERMPDVVNQVVTEGITRELTTQIAGLINQGVDPQDIGPDIIRAIIQQQLPIILLNGLQRELPRVLSNDFRTLGPGILQGALRDPNSGLTTDIRGELLDEFNDAIDDTIDDLNDEPLSAQGRNQLGILIGNAGQFRDELLNGSINLIGDSIENNPMFGQFSNEIAGQMEDILSQQLNIIFSQQEFRESINSASNQLADSLSDELADLGDELSDIALTSLDNTINEVVAQISAPISQAVSDTMTTALSAVANPINAAIGGMVNLITEPIVAITGGLVNSITEPFTSAMDGLVDSVVQPFADGLSDMMDRVLSPITELSNRITQRVNDFVNGAIDQVINILPFARVPTDALVNDQSGISIDTKKIRDLENKNCADTETAKKIAADMQKKELVDDRKASEQSAKNLDKIGNQVVNFIKKNELVKDPATYVREAREEAMKIGLAELERSSDTFRKQTLKTLKGDELNDPYQSTLSRSEYQELINNPDQLDSATFWDRFLKFHDFTKNNNPSSSLLNNLAIQSQRQAAAEQNARDEYLAGQGIAPKKECNKYDQENNCVKWITVTPGRIIGANLESVNEARIEKLVSVDEQTDLVKGAEPNTELIQTLNAPGASRANGLINFFHLGGGNGGSNLGGNLPNINPGDLLNLIPPTARIRFTSPSLGNITNGTAPNTATINWSLIIGDSCVAGNPWLSAGSATGTLQVLKRSGEEVERYGSLSIKFPFTFEVAFTRTRNTTESNLTIAPSISGDRLRGNASLALQTSDIVTGDVITIKLAAGGTPSSVSVTVAENDTVSTMIDKLKAAIGANPTFALYRFTYTSLTSIGTGQIDITTAPPVYRLRCTNGTQSAEVETTIVR